METPSTNTQGNQEKGRSVNRRAVKAEEIENLQKKLNEGCFESQFSWIFWQTLHSSYGSLLGYTFGFLLILVMNHEWMVDEFTDTNEGHSVAKTFVILFLIYSYSVITLALEMIQLVFLIVELFFPYYGKIIRERLEKTVTTLESVRRMRCSKYFFTPIVMLWCMFASWIGSVFWVWFWWNHICKSYHDKTCRNSWLGQMVIHYRDEACYDGSASSMMCERFVSYFPIMVFTVCFVFVGNVILPLLNDQLSLYYPMSETLEFASDAMDRLENEICESRQKDTSTPIEAKIEKSDAISNESSCQGQGRFEISSKKHVNTLGSLMRKLAPSALFLFGLLMLDVFVVKKIFLQS